MLKPSYKTVEGKSLISMGLLAILAISYLVSGTSVDLNTALAAAESSEELSEMYKIIALLKDGGVVDVGIIVSILTFMASMYKNFTGSRTQLKEIAIQEEASVRKEIIKSGQQKEATAEITRITKQDLPKAY